jgi:hypothetical protein
MTSSKLSSIKIDEVGVLRSINDVICIIDLNRNLVNNKFGTGK